MALADVVDFLRCPHCHAGLALTGVSLRCGAGHSFDVARQGYVSLLPGDAHTGSADTAAMVQSRDAFLAAGHYAAIAETVAAECERAAERSGGCVVDLGAGTGYWLAAALERLPDRAGLALDISKPALRRAAKAHSRIGAVACDAWGPLPVASGAGAVVLSVFAPRNGAEIARVLGADGRLVVVSPTERHLAELVAPLGLLSVDEGKQDRLEERLGPFLAKELERELEKPMSLGHPDVATAAAMGPSAWHTDPDELGQRIRALPDPVPVAASVRVSVWAEPTA